VKVLPWYFQEQIPLQGSPKLLSQTFKAPERRDLSGALQVSDIGKGKTLVVTMAIYIKRLKINGRRKKSKLQHCRGTGTARYTFGGSQPNSQE